MSAWGLDILIVGAAAASVLGTIARDDADRPDGLQLWFEVVAIGAVLLSLCARRRFPFLAPAFVWIGSAALSFLDHQLITTQPGVFLCGMGASVLLGSLRHGLQARVGLVVVVVCAAVVVYNDPTEDVADLVFTTALFIRWPGSWGTPCATGSNAARPRRTGRCAPSGSGSRPPGWRWPRNAHGWPGSSTTWSPMR